MEIITVADCKGIKKLATLHCIALAMTGSEIFTIEPERLHIVTGGIAFGGETNPPQ